LPAVEQDPARTCGGGTPQRAAAGTAALRWHGDAARACLQTCKRNSVAPLGGSG